MFQQVGAEGSWQKLCPCALSRLFLPLLLAVPSTLLSMSREIPRPITWSPASIKHFLRVQGKGGNRRCEHFLPIYASTSPDTEPFSISKAPWETSKWEEKKWYRFPQNWVFVSLCLQLFSRFILGALNLPSHLEESKDQNFPHVSPLRRSMQSSWLLHSSIYLR